MTAAPASELPGDVGPSGRPVWALTGEQMLAELDALHVEACRTENRRLALLAGMEQVGHAKDIGARSTAELIALRHRLDYQQVHRDLKLAKALPKYPIVQQGLDNGPHTGPFDPADVDAAGANLDGANPDDATQDGMAQGATGQADADTGDARNVGRLGCMCGRPRRS